MHAQERTSENAPLNPIAQADAAAEKLIADARNHMSVLHDATHHNIYDDVVKFNADSVEIGSVGGQKAYLAEMNKRLEQSGWLPVVLADFGLEAQPVADGSPDGKKYLDQQTATALADPSKTVQAMFMQDMQARWQDIASAGTKYHFGEEVTVQGFDNALNTWGTKNWYSQIFTEEKQEPAAKNLSSPEEVRQLLIKDFARIDTDGDGKITAGDINKSMNLGGFTGDDAALILSLSMDQKLWFNGLGTKKENGFTLDQLENADLTKPMTGNWAGSELGESMLNSYNGDVGLMMNNLGNGSIPMSLYAANDAISPDAVVQGYTGDCYFLASLAGVAKNNPDSIKQMLTDNKDGTYTVKFPGIMTPITVSAPSQAELAEFSQITPHGFWVPVLEKAWESYKEQGSPDIQDQGGWPADALSALTGEPGHSYMVNSVNGKVDQAELDRVEKLLAFATASGDPMTADTGGNSKHRIGAFPENHAFTLIGYDPTTHIATVRNPWGPSSSESIADCKNAYSEYAKDPKAWIAQNGKDTPPEIPDGIWDVPGKPGYYNLSIENLCKIFPEIDFANSASTTANIPIDGIQAPRRHS